MLASKKKFKPDIAHTTMAQVISVIYWAIDNKQAAWGSTTYQSDWTLYWQKELTTEAQRLSCCGFEIYQIMPGLYRHSREAYHEKVHTHPLSSNPILLLAIDSIGFGSILSWYLDQCHDPDLSTCIPPWESIGVPRKCQYLSPNNDCVHIADILRQ